MAKIENQMTKTENLRSESFLKVVLSRKGFDSGYGGYPSPILPDGRLISLPIPRARREGDKICYSELKLKLNNTTKSYYEVMKELKPERTYKIKAGKKKQSLNEETICHLDPDIYRSVINRPKEWKPLCGRAGNGQGHLDKQEVKENDIFLFFGTFRRIIKKGGWEFDLIKPKLHIIYGYFQIGEIKKVETNTKCDKWMNYFPHTTKEFRQKKNNTIYIARDTLSWNSKLPGAGVLKYHDDLVLTKKGETKSRWRLPLIFKKVKISYHSEASWNKQGYFQSASIGQSFVVQTNKEVEEWVRTLISKDKLQS